MGKEKENEEENEEEKEKKRKEKEKNEKERTTIEKVIGDLIPTVREQMGFSGKKEIPIEKVSAERLKEELKAANRPTSGKKEELLNRFKEVFPNRPILVVDQDFSEWAPTHLENLWSFYYDVL